MSDERIRQSQRPECVAIVLQQLARCVFATSRECQGNRWPLIFVRASAAFTADQGKRHSELLRSNVQIAQCATNTLTDGIDVDDLVLQRQTFSDDSKTKDPRRFSSELRKTTSFIDSCNRSPKPNGTGPTCGLVYHVAANCHLCARCPRISLHRPVERCTGTAGVPHVVIPHNEVPRALDC